MIYKSHLMISKILILILGIYSQLAGQLPAALSPSSSQLTNAPWLTGPLIAPPGTVIQGGHFEIESYLYVIVNTGSYTKHWHVKKLPHHFVSINPQIFCLFGVTKWMDLQIIPQLFYNITQGKSSVHFGDLPVGVDFQLYSADAKGWFPGIKLTLRETFPIGKYQKLKPWRKGTDLSGQGSFQSTAALEFYKVYSLKRNHFLSTTLYFSYTYLAPVHVKGFNSYGGGYHTDGTVRPGGVLQGIISFEYTLSQNWAFSIDNVYIHTNNDHFSGHRGVVDSGNIAKVGSPSSEQISFAPGIEYNFSSGFGINAGAWVSAWGRNSPEFRSFVINFDYNY